MGDFEKQIKQLEDIIKNLDNGDISLDDSIGLYEKGMNLTKQLQKELDKNEARINIIMDGKEQPFDNEHIEKVAEAKKAVTPKKPRKTPVKKAISASDIQISLEDTIK